MTHKCQSWNATKLCIYDAAFKLKQIDTYDIGGTYSETGPELWFYYSTTLCPGNNYLLNLFVCHRTTGNFSIGISNSNELTHKKKHKDICGQSTLPETLTWYTFRSAQPNEKYYIKTFCFNETNTKALESNTLNVPITIVMNSTVINSDVVKRIKLDHDFGGLLTQQDKTDFVLESASRKQYKAHKIILAAHSQVLREMIKNSTSEFIDISDNDMELLLQFIYTGTIKDILNQDWVKLLEIADRFKLNNLFLLTQNAIGEQINEKNAVEIALISEKYNLEQLQQNVFNFIKNKPEVMESEGWKNLNDVNLAKKLFQFMHTSKSKD